jgi:hypothetical protein
MGRDNPAFITLTSTRDKGRKKVSTRNEGKLEKEVK